MAKGKQKESKAKPASKKKDNTLLYGIGVLILIIIIVLVIRSGKEPAGPADIEVTPSQPTTQPETTTETQSTLPQGVTEELACTAGAAIGFKSCSLLANGDVEVTVLHSVSSVVTPLTLTGAQYYLYDENGEKLSEASQMGEVQPGQEAKYTLPLSGNPSAMKVEVRPVVNDGGVDKICVNQRVIVIPANSCR